jgi:hypothetical protein
VDAAAVFDEAAGVVVVAGVVLEVAGVVVVSGVEESPDFFFLPKTTPRTIAITITTNMAPPIMYFLLELAWEASIYFY